MADTIAILTGGPCGGEHKVLTAGEIRSQTLACGGTTYVASPDSTFIVGVVNYFEPAASVTPPALPYGTKDVSAAWSRLNRSLVKAGNTELPRIRAATAQINRIALPRKRG